MQSKARKYLKKLFDQHLPKHLLGYVPFRTVLPPGGFAYVKRGHHASFFVIVTTWAPRDEFTLEVAWNRDESMPRGYTWFGPKGEPVQTLPEPSGRARIGQLMCTDDHWWRLVERRPLWEEMSDEEFLESLKPPIIPLESIEGAMADALEVLVRHWAPLCAEFEVK